VRDAVAGAITGVVEGWEPGILLSMAADPDAGVRTRAAGGLALWAMPEARHALTGLLDDPVLAVRQVAENALVRMHPELDVHQAAMAVFRGTAVRARAHAARTLGRTGAVPFGRELMGALEGETEPVLVSGVVHALGSLGAVYAAQSLDTLCSHGSAQVRAAAAEALGKLRVPATYARLMELAFDPDPRVQEASILAMARTESAVFSDVLRQILMDMDPSDGTVIRARERSLACWAAGRLRPVSMPLMDRLVTQATTPVIPLPGGRAFEEDSILITAAFSLVHCAHADARVRPLAETVIAAHMGPEMAFMPNSFELREYGRQALAFYERRPATPGLRPFRRVEFPFGPVEETPEPEPEAPDQEWTE
jgi:HEAT repeat protein